MRARIHWGLMRVALRLAQALPCTATERWRSSQTRYCYNHMWSDLR